MFACTSNSYTPPPSTSPGIATHVDAIELQTAAAIVASSGTMTHIKHESNMVLARDPPVELSHSKSVKWFLQSKAHNLTN